MKAVVLETRGKEAAVLVEDGTVRIVHGSYSIGDTLSTMKRPGFACAIGPPLQLL